MKLDLAEMTGRNGCFPGLEWWQTTFGDGPVDYQDVLNCLAAEDRVDWARWLMHEVGADKDNDVTDGMLIRPVGSDRKHAFFAGDAKLRDVTISGVLLVAGRLETANIDAQSVIAEDGIRAQRITVHENIICAGGLIMASEMRANNIRSGDCIIADRIHALGTVRAVKHIACPQIEADSIVEYCTGLKPHKARTGAAKTGHIGARRSAPGFTLERD